MRLSATLLCWLILMATSARADPARYLLDQDRSRVGFVYLLNGVSTDGTMPVAEADILLDLANLPASRVSVALQASRARAGQIFATEAMRSPSVLDTARFPLIRFQSSAVEGTLNAARVKGQLTLRGVTLPITLDAQLYRQTGSAAGDLSRLSVLLTGSVSRNAFGAHGFRDLVSDRIDLVILVRMNRAGG